MADRASVSKSVGYVLTGTEAAAKATKVVAYIILEPGDDGTSPARQAQVHTQILRRS